MDSHTAPCSMDDVIATYEAAVGRGIRYAYPILEEHPEILSKVTVHLRSHVSPPHLDLITDVYIESGAAEHLKSMPNIKRMTMRSPFGLTGVERGDCESVTSLVICYLYDYANRRKDSTIDEDEIDAHPYLIDRRTLPAKEVEEYIDRQKAYNFDGNLLDLFPNLLELDSACVMTNCGHLSEKTDLTTLRLKQQSNINAEILARLTRLEHLTLTRVANIPATVFEGMTSLQDVTLNYCLRIDLHLASRLKTLTVYGRDYYAHGTAVEIRSVNSRPSKADYIDYSHWPRTIEKLTLMMEAPQSRDYEADPFPLLETLDITFGSMTVLHAPPKCPNLKSIALRHLSLYEPPFDTHGSRSDFTQPRYAKMSSGFLRSFPTLQSIDYHLNPTMADLSLTNGELEGLDQVETFRCYGHKELTSVEGMPKLKELVCKDTDITSFEANPEIVTLSIAHPRIKGEALKHLPKLKTLDCWRCPSITCDDLNQLPSLESVGLLDHVCLGDLRASIQVTPF